MLYGAESDTNRTGTRWGYTETDRDQMIPDETGEGPDQDQTRTGPGPDEDQTRTNEDQRGPDEDQTRTRREPDEDQTRTRRGSAGQCQ